MEYRFEEVSLPGVFGVEKLQKLKYEFLINDLFANRRLEVRGLKETQEELIHELELIQN